jgi:hypothetical protein
MLTLRDALGSLPARFQEDTMSAAASEKQKAEICRIERALDALLSAIDPHDEWCDQAGVRS